MVGVDDRRIRRRTCSIGCNSGKKRRTGRAVCVRTSWQRHGRREHHLFSVRLCREKHIQCPLPDSSPLCKPIELDAGIAKRCVGAGRFNCCWAGSPHGKGIIESTLFLLGLGRVQKRRVKGRDWECQLRDKEVDNASTEERGRRNQIRRTVWSKCNGRSASGALLADFFNDARRRRNARCAKRGSGGSKRSASLGRATTGVLGEV